MATTHKSTVKKRRGPPREDEIRNFHLCNEHVSVYHATLRHVYVMYVTYVRMEIS